MYNRYIPGTNGIYHCEQMEEKQQDLPCPPSPQCHTCTHTAEPAACARQTDCSGGFDLGDILLLCIVLLLLLDAEQDDLLPLLITAAAFLIPQ